MTLAQKIHELRIANGMTMDELAKQIGVQRSAINKYEKGIVVDLKRSTIASLARAFGVSPCFLMDDSATIVEGSGISEEYYTLNEEEKRLVALWRGAESSVQEIVMENLENHQKKDTKQSAI